MRDLPGPLTTRTGALRGDDAENGNYVPQIVGQAVNAKWAKGSSGPAGDETHNMIGTTAGVRRLTPTECERLQAWPDGWTDPNGNAPDSRRYAAAGDGVTATVSEWIGRRLVEATP